MKKNITIFLLAAGVLALLYFLLHDKPAPDTHASDNAIVQADKKILLEQRNIGLKRIDSLETDAKRRDTLEAKQKADLALYRHDLDKSTAKAVQLARDIKELQRQQQDTTAFGRKADSLASEAINYAWLYEQYKASSDSLSVLVDSNKAIFETVKAEQKRLYDDLFVKYDQLSRLYDALYKDHQQGGKQLRREKLKTKIAAIIGLIGLGAAALK